MKYLRLIWSGIWRKRTRAVLILLQVIIAFTLFGVLQGLDTGIKQAVAKAHADRLYVLSRVSGGDLLPAALLSEIQKVPGVLAVTYQGGMGGTYQNLDQQVAANAVDAGSFARIFPEVVIPRAQLEALVNTRTGALVGEELARRYGWKIGQRIPLESPLAQRDGSREWHFDVVGFFSVPEQTDRANYLIINYAYLNEAREANRDTVNDFVVQIADPKRSASIGHDIDTLFANSSHETRTQSESELVSTQVQRIGDIDFLAHAVTAAAFFALLFSTGALMMQSIRERTSELAVLKTVGFTDSGVMVLILAEALLLCLLGAAVGLGIAAALLPRARQLIGIGAVPTIVVALGFLFAVLLAFVSGAIPAWRGRRLQVATALSRH
ncbi:MAG TPA: FtsX-like permease family protein [Stellaceae bacterium]|nr:FtsX-like permease family protein [Stellaceae bacterium]